MHQQDQYACFCPLEVTVFLLFTVSLNAPLMPLFFSPKLKQKILQVLLLNLQRLVVQVSVFLFITNFPVFNPYIHDIVNFHRSNPIWWLWWVFILHYISRYIKIIWLNGFQWIFSFTQSTSFDLVERVFKSVFKMHIMLCSSNSNIDFIFFVYKSQSGLSIL